MLHFCLPASHGSLIFVVVFFATWVDDNSAAHASALAPRARSSHRIGEEGGSPDPARRRDQVPAIHRGPALTTRERIVSRWYGELRPRCGQRDPPGRADNRLRRRFLFRWPRLAGVPPPPVEPTRCGVLLGPVAAPRPAPWPPPQWLLTWSLAVVGRRGESLVIFARPWRGGALVALSVDWRAGGGSPSRECRRASHRRVPKLHPSPPGRLGVVRRFELAVPLRAAAGLDTSVVFPALPHLPSHHPPRFPPPRLPPSATVVAR